MDIKILMLVLLFAVNVHSEVCTVNGDCSDATNCSTGFHKICEHPPNADGTVPNGGLCTCAKNDYDCSSLSDCVPINLGCISDQHKHCYDAKCICTRW